MKAIRKSLAVLLCLAILIGFVSIQSSAAQSVWDGTFPAVNGSAKYSGGKGTKTDPYKIATAKDLAQLSVNTQEIKNYSEGKYFEQTADIVLNTQDMFTFDSDGRVTGIAAGKSPKQWKPIGKAIYNPGGSIADRAFTFYGHYRGDHHKISGIYIDTDESYQGFFGMIVKGSVSEVEIEMSYIKGYISVGGIVGYNDEGTLFECGFAGCVSGYNEVGGVVGANFFSTVTDSYNTGSVSGINEVGGVVGFNSSSTISNCYYLNTSVSNPTNSFGVALTDAQMRNSASFGGFDFDTVWMIDSSAAYPYPTLAGLSHVALEIAVTGVSLNMTSLTMSVGETKTLNATVSPADATDKRVTWSSSNTAVATVNENGVVTAISTGTTVITVTTTDGSKTAQCTVTVKEPVIKMKSGAGYKLNTSGSIVYNIKPGTKVSDLLKNFEGGTLEVRDKNGTLLSGDKTFGSGAKLNLIAGGKVVDTLTLAVLGDIDGDGKVLASDARQVLRHAAKLTTLGELEQLSANTDGEAGVKASDARIILRVAAKLQTL